MRITLKPTKKSVTIGPDAEAMVFTGQSSSGIGIVAQVVCLSILGHEFVVGRLGVQHFINWPLHLTPTGHMIEFLGERARLWKGESKCGTRVVVAICDISVAHSHDVVRFCHELLQHPYSTQDWLEATSHGLPESCRPKGLLAQLYGQAGKDGPL